MFSLTGQDDYYIQVTKVPYQATKITEKNSVEPATSIDEDTMRMSDEHTPQSRKPRRPRRARFSGRTTPGGDHLTTAARTGREQSETQQNAKTAALSHAAIPVPSPAHPSSTSAAGTADFEQRVDDLELSASGTKFSRLIGERLSEKLGPATTYLRRTGSFLVTSPGRMTTYAVVLVIAILAAGLSMSQTTNARQQQLVVMAQQSEPMSHAAQNLYASLTIADASANTSFSQGTVSGSTELRTKYDNAIAQASMAATRAATGINDVNSVEMAEIANIQRLLPVYTGLVESARANARQGHSVGVAYLASASGLMRDKILPSAQTLYDRTSDRTAANRQELTAPPWVPMSGILAAILLLLWVQWRLTRANGRLFNVGLFAATLCMLAALTGVAAVTVTTWQNEKLYGEKTAPLLQLTEARIHAQQLRSTETLNLVRRQPADANAFANSLGSISDSLHRIDSQQPNQDVKASISSAADWNKSHSRMMDQLSTGDYAGAIATATDGNNQSSSAAAFQDLDNSLQSAISDARTELRMSLDNARRASAAISLVTIAVTILAAILVVLGFRSRLLEYL